ncbi:MAG: 50S ribosomal protein L3 [Verrucomicrobia bacterium]|mgnify:FL=1|jgi:large subunit ribosomal protein L3|nr:50S ribosomal protein L3 [Verrucomicrobiota bacterium]MBT3912841.1 50S ribosomal protein L3 [Verrucomicrobiota bacterium]MBT4623815.1 50S ribosomal protein L3 [Verrucomicrobiota bacterium]MBT5311135.1 50S ribosomal protein L3 [Verrucomicrobiota bacterium]MBT5620241.1 50S ribosomal protein L3 [Verrucomicrobiota bacterium]
MVGLLGKKLGQTRVYTEEGRSVSVTIVQAGPNQVLQRKTTGKDGYEAVQLGFDGQKEHRLNLAKRGHLKAHNGEKNYTSRSPDRTVKGKARLANRKDWDARAITPIRRIKEFRDFSLDVKTGDSIGADVFEPGDYVDVIGKTKGRGFQGVVKRWNFGGGRGSHGSGGWRRRPGSIGAGSTPGHVIKGKHMPGHMGQASRTVQNLEIIQVQTDDNLLLVKGAIPGANGDYVVIRESKKKPKKSK